MSPRHFSSKGGPYFVGQTFSQHKEHQDDLDNKGLAIIPIIGKIVTLLKFPRFKRDK
jgi:hypothetical protein